MISKPRFNKNVRSSQPWEPQTSESFHLKNRSSGSYCIISGTPVHDSAHKFDLRNPVSYSQHKRKGITEYQDIENVSYLNTSIDYQRSFNSNPYEFRRRNGQFTNLYDAAYRFGESQVFKP